MGPGLATRRVRGTPVGGLPAPSPDSRHDAGQVEELCRQVGHVAVEEDEERLDDTNVGSEAGGEGCDDTVDHAHKDSAQGHDEEAQEAEDDVHNAHAVIVGKLLEEVIQDLEEACRLVGGRAGSCPMAPRGQSRVIPPLQ